MNGEEYYCFPMSRKIFCDDCNQEVKLENTLRIWGPDNHPLFNAQFCNSCFNRHWKPISKRFSLKKFMAQLTKVKH